MMMTVMMMMMIGIYVLSVKNDCGVHGSYSLNDLCIQFGLFSVPTGFDIVHLAMSAIVEGVLLDVHVSACQNFKAHNHDVVDVLNK